MNDGWLRCDNILELRFVVGADVSLCMCGSECVCICVCICLSEGVWMCVREMGWSGWCVWFVWSAEYLRFHLAGGICHCVAMNFSLSQSFISFFDGAGWKWAVKRILNSLNLQLCICAKHKRIVHTQFNYSLLVCQPFIFPIRYFTWSKAACFQTLPLIKTPWQHVYFYTERYSLFFRPFRYRWDPVTQNDCRLTLYTTYSLQREKSHWRLSQSEPGYRNKVSIFFQGVILSSVWNNWQKIVCAGCSIIFPPSKKEKKCQQLWCPLSFSSQPNDCRWIDTERGWGGGWGMDWMLFASSLHSQRFFMLGCCTFIQRLPRATGLMSRFYAFLCHIEA